ncbi:MAG: DUF3426 domain-containing protein [Gammaproteobacteria bacterium]
MTTKYRRREFPVGSPRFMFTRCPECKTVFRVTDQQLDAAGGRVRCGHCAAIFNARDSLADSAAELQQRDTPRVEPDNATAPADAEPGAEFHPYATDYSEFLQPPAAPRPPPEERAGIGDNDELAQPTAPTEPHGENLTPRPHPHAIAGGDHAATPEPTAEDLVPRPYPATEDAGEPPAASVPRQEDLPIEEQESPEPAEAELPPEHPPAGPAPHAREPAPAPEDQAVEETAAAAVPVAPEQAQTTPGQEEESAPPSSAAEPQQLPAATAANEPVPSILEDDLQALARRRSGWRTFAWGLLVVGLILAFAIQYAYFNRADLARNAQLRPWLERACQWAGCSIALTPELNKLRFLNSTVMVDPQQNDRLLILATMVNTAQFPQPYPLLEVRLTSLDGKVVAMRRFKPREYLPNDIDAAQGLQPDTPLSVKLEVVRPQQSVTGYQFDFR